MQKRLFRFDYKQGTTMNEHITMFNQLVADVLNLDVKFRKENVSLDVVCSALYSHDLRKQNKQH